MQCGRVGRRLLSMKSLRFRKISEAFLFFLPADLFLLRWGYSSSDFTDESDGNLAYRITYGFPRIFGRWLMALARNELRFFCHADFADDADFFSLIILVPQISQIYTDFFSLII